MLSRSNADNITHPGRAARKRDVVRIARGPWAGRIGVVEAVHGRHLTVRVDPKWTKAQHARISARVGELRREGLGRPQAVREAFEEFRRKEGGGMKFLVNPPRRGRSKSMARRLPARDSRGRFKKRGGSRRKNPSRKRSKRTSHRERWSSGAHPRNARGQFVRKNPRRGGSHRRRSGWSSRAHPRNRFGEFVRKHGRSHRRHNPPISDLPRFLGRGALDAVEIVGGKAATKVIPGMLKLPTTGNTGLAVQVGIAVALGWLADYVGGEDLGRQILAGGLTAPIETFVVQKNVPYVAPALTTGTLSSWSPGPPANAARALPAPGRLGAWSKPGFRMLQS